MAVGTLPTSPNYCCYTTVWMSKQWKCNITVGYYQRKLHRMYRICFIEMDLQIIKFGMLCTNICTKQRFVTSMTYKNAYANLVWLWTDRYRGCDWLVARQSEIMYACWWRTLRTHAVKLLFISIMWFIGTFYETFNVIRCIRLLFRSWR